METVLDQLISDFQERDIPSFTHRDIEVPWLKGKIDTIVGMRRSGKTWLLFQLISDLISKGMPKESLLYMNFEDDRVQPMTGDDLKQLVEIYFRRYPQNRERVCSLLFDEIQAVPGWERFIRRLLDTENVHICLTGSSAKFLSREIATTLRGRSISTEVFPFSFMEALRHAQIEYTVSHQPGARHRSLLENRFRAYLLEGGFPEVQGLEARHRVRILQEYLDVVILRDLIERYGITNVVPIRYLIRHLLNAPATSFSVNKFYNDLKSQGIPCGKNTLHEYLEFLADAYLVFPITVHTRSARARMVNPRKVYAIDTGLAQAYIRSVQPDWGHLLENFVFLELRRRGGLLEYYRTSSGREVDFFVTTLEGHTSLVQVALDITGVETRKREVGSLSEAMEECGLREALLITLDQQDKLKTHEGCINVLPAWLWALKGVDAI
jgi:predicted AAA+ superfamily ATPase